MVLQMARPQKNPRSGVRYFRQTTPADLVFVFGRKEVSWSLGTKDPDEAEARNADGTRKQALVWGRLRKRPRPAITATVNADRLRRRQRCSVSTG